MPVPVAYGARSLLCPEPEGVRLRAVSPPRPAPLPDLAAALDAALAHPSGARPLASVATARSRVVVVVPGASGAAPRWELLAAVRRALAAVPDDHLTLAVANGTHAPAPLERLGLGDALARYRVVNPDPEDEASTVEMGRTSRGTRVRVHRCVAEADLVVTTGRIAPHPVNGYGGGAAGIFPGLALGEDARASRAALELEPGSALGEADANPYREDLEEAVRRLGRDTYMLGVAEAGGAVVGAVAGDVLYAHREGVRLARPWCEVEAARADAVVVSAPLPFSSSLERASRLIPAGGLLLREGGTLILAAECPDGAGSLERVGPEAFAARLRRHLPERHEVVLVSALGPGEVGRTYARFAPDLASALALARDRAGGAALDVAVVPDATDVVPRRVR
jgi:nickel-dependent lactate racemase